MQLRVLTLNVWFEQAARRWRDQVAAIRTFKPDVVCLQEVQSMDLANKFREAFAGEYECAHFRGRLSFGTVAAFGVAWALLYSPWVLLAQFGVLSRQKLGASISALALAAVLWRNPGQCSGFFIGNRTGLLLFARKGRVKSISTSATLFQEWAYDYLNWIRPRGFLAIDARLQVDGRTEIPFKAITTHLDQLPNQPKGRGRIRQAEEMLALVSDFEGLSVLAGDLNFTKLGVPGGTSCGTYERIRKDMSDAWDVNAEPCVTWDQVNNPLAVSQLNDLAYGAANSQCESSSTIPQWQQQVDYVFWKHQGPGKVSCSSCEVVFKDPVLSDHYGVMATFDITAE